VDSITAQTLIDKSLVKMQNFPNSKNKFNYLYLYLLTSRGIDEKVTLTSRFLNLGVAEYEALKLEIKALQKEIKEHMQLRNSHP
jgi:hypothetical protein